MAVSVMMGVLRKRWALVATALLTVLSTGWCALNAGAQWGPPLLGWLPAVASFAVMTWELLAVSRSPELTPAARRFWRTFGIANAANTAALVLQVYYAVTGRTDPAKLPRPSIAFFLIAVLMILWALLRLPVGARSPAEWRRLVLDGATVMAASALFAWHFALEPLLDRPFDSLVLWGTVGAGVLLQVAVAAVVKVLLAGTGPVHPASLRVLCLGLFAGSFMAGVSAFIADNSEVVPSQLVMGPLAFTATLAAARQRRAAKTGAASRVTRGRRPFSLLPYAAVAATQILLIATVGDPHTGAAVVAGAVLVTALVVVRQWGAFTEISRLLATVRSQEERLRHQATHDALTHLANRTLFGERLEGELQQDAAPAVLLIDLDDFKTVNDTLGHAVGDELLQVVADRLRACVRPGDMVARLGGDEFAILLAGVDHGAAEEVARRIMARLEQPAQVGSHHLPVGASVGVAMAATGDDAGSLLRNADIAMYSAKRGGKADVAWYSGGMASAEGVPVASRERFSQALLPQREC